MVTITDVLPRSRAHRAGIRPKDILLSINGHEINDVLDYRFYLAEASVELSVQRGDEIVTAVIRKDVYDDIGLDFETPLMDKKHSCRNKCIFCFIDQLPKGMRESLYFKDDDSRLSFLHGNYITMTNLSRRDIDRMIEMHISPVNISVHTTNPELRVKMTKNKNAGEVLKYLDVLAEAGVKMRGQIVLCKGVNDGAELDRTMNDLFRLYPSMESVSIVPAGLTRHREGLYPLEPFSPSESAEVVKQVESFASMCRQMYGEGIFYCSDEMYLKAGLQIPDPESYGEFTQLENGVGMLALFRDEFDSALKTLTEEDRIIERSVSVATGEAAFHFINSLARKISEICPGLKCRVYKVKNNFFGGEVNVSGLLTGRDIAEQLMGAELGEELLLPKNTLRSEGDLFLCGMTPDELSKRLGVPVKFNENDGGEFLYALLGI